MRGFPLVLGGLIHNDHLVVDVLLLDQIADSVSECLLAPVGADDCRDFGLVR